MGMTLAEAALGIRSVPPFRNRMYPVTRPDGVTFLFDDAKSPYWTIPATFAFIKRASASRRFIVMGTISDYTGSSEKATATVAKEALRCADHVVFVGRKASKSLPARQYVPATPLHAFYSMAAAREHLAGILRDGDLVLLKGIPNDGLERIYATPARTSGAAESISAAGSATAPPDPPRSATKPWVQAVVGFGNPAERYRDSPHNVGQEVVELLARFFGAEWTVASEALLATIPFSGRHAPF